ncbi:MAG: hypothetical protein KF886_14195 [Candidatus Hydrogenedentes bacterium]|nr:hypothetical protein [Candidatus Hydrogenedentota bacterium]
MNLQERAHLTSEIAMLNDLLSKTPKERVIHRKGFEARLRAVRELLDSAPEQTEAHSGKVLFRGEPIVGTHGMFASFAGRAAHAFSEAVATVTEGLAGTLGNMGPIAGGDRSRLLITGTATGSFGFAFEVPVEPTLPGYDGPGSVALAIPKIQDLFSEASQGEVESLADIVADIHPRAVRKVREFLDVLVEYGAWCSLEYQDRPFAFKDVSEVQETCFLLRDENMAESDTTVVGVMEGILPTARQIELRVPEEEILRLRIRREIKDVEALKALMDKRIKVQLHVTRLANRKPRYELTAVPELA